MTAPREPTGSEERWLLERLGNPNLFLGHTTRDIRMQRVRDRVLKLELVDKSAGNRVGADGDRQPETFAQVFERLYAEPFFPQPQQSGEI